MKDHWRRAVATVSPKLGRGYFFNYLIFIIIIIFGGENLRDEQIQSFFW
jgi:hypothetical protein